MTHLQDFTFTGFLQFQKLLVVSSSFIDFKVMPTCVTNHYKSTIYLTFSEGSLFCKFFHSNSGSKYNYEIFVLLEFIVINVDILD